MGCTGGFINENIGSPGKRLHVELIKKSLIKERVRSLKLAPSVNQNCIFTVYKELKREVGFEEYLQYVKGERSGLFFKFLLGTHWLFKALGRRANRGGSQECPNCGAYKESVEHVLF